MTAGHEALSADRTGDPAAYASEALWWCCVMRGQTSAAGVLLDDIATALSDLGQPALSLWPYNLSLGFGTEDPPAAAGAGPWETAKIDLVPLRHDGVEDPLEDHLAAGRPVVLVLEVTTEFEGPGTTGEIAIPPLTAPDGDYHAVIAVGADTRPNSGRCLLIRNSWGRGWGMGGYAWLPLGYLESFAVEAAVVVSQ